MDGYEYGNTRIRAMKSRLLSAEVFAALSSAGSIDRWILVLSQTSYRRAVEAAISIAPGMAGVPEIFRHNLAETTGRIPGFYTGQPATLIRLLFLHFDLQNIKTILRRLAQGFVAGETFPSILLSGTISEPILAEITKTGQLRSAIDLMATLRLPFAKPLLELRQTQPGAAMQQIELALEKWYFDYAYDVLKENESLESFTANSIKMDADFTNLLVCLRLLHYPEERLRLGRQAISLMVKPGFISLDLLEKCIYQKDIETGIHLLADTPYGKCLQEGLRRYRQMRQLSAFEKELKRYRLRWKAALIAKDPLGCGVPIGYLALKENEIFNLRQTALLTHLGFQGAEIMAQLEFLS